MIVRKGINILRTLLNSCLYGKNGNNSIIQNQKYLISVAISTEINF